MVPTTCNDSSGTFLEHSPIVVSTAPKISLEQIRCSLRASSLDGVFAAVFSSITGGVLLTDFLLKLGANSIEIGMMSSIPMVVNLLQPLGAYFADQSRSRHNYCLWIFGISRLLWLILAFGIGWIGLDNGNSHRLVIWTLAILFAANILGGMGGSAWVSWMAVLVPHRLRGRYFGFRNSLASLTTLISVPLLGFAVSSWGGGKIQGYGIVLFIGILAGFISLGCQFFMADVNPQQLPVIANVKPHVPTTGAENTNILKNKNFLLFLLYFGLWTFAVNLSNPFWNLYMLDNLQIDISWVTLYASITSAANLVMLLLWGKLADRWGNRPLLLLVGLMVAVIPLFWFGTDGDTLSIWLWIPLLHLVNAAMWAAIDLCSANIQMEIAGVDRPTKYFAIAAAVAGVSGAIGTTAGGFLANINYIGGLSGLFAISVMMRLLALLPLVFVREPRSQSVMHILQELLSFKLASPFLASRKLQMRENID